MQCGTHMVTVPIMYHVNPLLHYTGSPRGGGANGGGNSYCGSCPDDDRQNYAPDLLSQLGMDPNIGQPEIGEEFCEQGIVDTLNLTDDEKSCMKSNPDLDSCALNGEINTYIQSLNLSTPIGTTPVLPQDEVDFLKEYLALKCQEPDILLPRFKELDNLIEADPMALIRECAMQNGLDTQAYINFYNHTLPPACETRLTNLGSGYENQPISDGNVPMASIDYYPVVLITDPNPDFNNDGSPDSDDIIFFDEFKKKFKNFASGSKNNFNFTCGFGVTTDITWDFDYLTPQDSTTFTSNNPITSVFLIEGGASNRIANGIADSGAVMISGFSFDNWIISTIRTPQNGSQPFSGNRQWGMNRNQNGSLEFYTRAVDVATRSNQVKVASLWDEEFAQDDYYNIADASSGQFSK